MGRARLLFLSTAAARFRILDARVLVLVAVDAEQLPVRAVGRIVVMVAVLVVDGELAQALAFELPAAARAEVGQELERLAAVIHQEPAMVRLAQSRTSAS